MECEPDSKEVDERQREVVEELGCGMMVARVAAVHGVVDSSAMASACGSAGAVRSLPWRSAVTSEQARRRVVLVWGNNI